MGDNGVVTTLTDVQSETPTLKLPPLQLGKLTIETPVVLAPMAGVTNRAFRRLCREYGGGLYVTEMVTARALVERNPESMRIISHDDDEDIRSIQIYGVDPATVGAAVRLVVDENRADHIDLNFGCPVPKVTRKGGGSALPWKSDLFTGIIEAATREAAKGDIPLTVKIRTGIDNDHLTYLESAKIARDHGAAAVTLHARTAGQYYAGHSDWSAITTLREAMDDMPVLGNGDIFSAEDAIEMVEQTGAAGVMVGRGCQGRPWIFGDLQAAFEGRADRIRPGVRKVADTVYRHGELLAEFFEDEGKGMRDIRKHIAWYFKGYPVGGEIRSQLAQVPSLERLRELLDQLDLDLPYPGDAAEGTRGRAGHPKKTHVPDGWLDSRIMTDAHREMIKAAELDISGG
ncbi:tRNA dihydrouridine synthase DusB [Glutamicibacter protophormiae]|uniref:tRNA dihydrouridine synthase DusB n=1 Tax=Glutamicibacter protophormiae TaxID=37930 RepID=UPI002A8177DA|nr:tRNA dihydrouridine synthase DusB [Glutamicibacter protophormiae]WPR65674.1 tRNA dihydrouridine synthase DusB [Glutamicibacter protophormiae]WPR69171.1 tRNA dihydrouridine synthase DusB [Glutamicibacter protophormiae]